MSDSIRRQHRFTITPEHLILDPRVSDRAMRLWCRLDRYAGEKESAFPSRETLCLDMDCSLASIDRAITELVQSGWLRKDRRAHGDVNEYVLIVAAEKSTQRLIEDARKERVQATAPRRAAAAKRRREQKRGVKGQFDASAQVNEGGVVMGDDTLSGGGVVTGDERGVVMGDERGVVTGDEEKEATLEGSIIEGDPPTPQPSAGASDDGALVLLQEIAPQFRPAPSFADFYAVYPRKGSRADAEKAWRGAIRTTDPAVIVDGARRLAADPNLPPREEEKYIKLAATWLRAACWEDPPLPSRAGGRGEAYSSALTWGTEAERAAQAEARRREFEAMTPEEQQAQIDRLFGDEQTG